MNETIEQWISLSTLSSMADNFLPRWSLRDTHYIILFPKASASIAIERLSAKEKNNMNYSNKTKLVSIYI